MARLPQPGGDSGNWGTILNDFLTQSLKSDGALKDNIVTSASIAPDAVTGTEIQDGSIQEAQLASSVQTKLNQAAPTWSTLSGKPAVIAAGSDQATARSVIGATALSVDGTPVSSYDLDSTPVTASDVGAYTMQETDDAIEAVKNGPVLVDPKISSSILDANGNTSIAISATANAVNYLRVENAPTNNAVALYAAGADTNVALVLRPKGTGTVAIYAPSAQTSGRIGISSLNANVDLNLASKGTGVVQANGVEIVTVSGAQIQTNKTLTSPKISSGNAPATSTSTGTAGQIEWDANYVYVCVATNTWKRSALSTW